MRRNAEKRRREGEKGENPKGRRVWNGVDNTRKKCYIKDGEDVRGAT